MATANFMTTPKVKAPTQPKAPKQQASADMAMAANKPSSTGGGSWGQGPSTPTGGGGDNGLGASQAHFAKAQAGMGQIGPMTANTGTSSLQRGPAPWGGSAQLQSQMQGMHTGSMGQAANPYGSGGGQWSGQLPGGGNVSQQNPASGYGGAPTQSIRSQPAQVNSGAAKPQSMMGGGQAPTSEISNRMGTFGVQGSPDATGRGGTQPFPGQPGGMNPRDPNGPPATARPQPPQDRPPQGGIQFPETWNPNLPGAIDQGPATYTDPMGGMNGFFGPNFDVWNPDSYKGDDPDILKYIAGAMPVATMDHNKYIDRRDFEETVRRDNRDAGMRDRNDIFQMDLSTRQQIMAELGMSIGVDQFDRTLDHTMTMDRAGLGISQQEVDQQGNRIQGEIDNWGAINANNAAAVGGQNERWGAMSTNEAASVAGQNKRWDAMSDNEKMAAMGQNERWGAMSANDARGLTLQELTQQQGNTLSYATLAQQAQQAQADRENMLSIANTQAYGRSAAPQMNWSRSWS